MVRALGAGDGKCSSMHGAASLLLTVPWSGVRALDPYRSAPRDPHVPGGAIRHIAVKLFGRFANNLDRPQEIGGDDRKRASIRSVAPASLSTRSCDPGRAIVCSLRLPLRPLQWP
jgi:hypothetical protein